MWLYKNPKFRCCKNNLLTELRCENTPLAYLNIGINDKLTKINKTDSNINLDLVGDTFDIKDIFKRNRSTKITVVEIRVVR